MFSLRDLRFVLCSRDLDILRVQRIMGFVILITHKTIPRRGGEWRGKIQIVELQQTTERSDYPDKAFICSSYSFLWVDSEWSLIH